MSWTRTWHRTTSYIYRDRCRRAAARRPERRARRLPRDGRHRRSSWPRSPSSPALHVRRRQDGYEVNADVPERRPAREGQPGAGRRPPDRHDHRHQAHRRRPRRGRDGARRVRAAARGHAARRSARTRCRASPTATSRSSSGPNDARGDRGRRRDPADDATRAGGPRPALQHARPGHARGPPEDRPGLGATQVDGKVRGGQREPSLPQPGAVHLVRSSRASSSATARRSSASSATPRGRGARSPSGATTSPRSWATPTPPRARSATRTWRSARALGPAAGHAAQRQHDVREPARDARRPRRARGRVEAGHRGPRAVPARAAPARARRPAHDPATCAR